MRCPASGISATQILLKKMQSRALVAEEVIVDSTKKRESDQRRRANQVHGETREGRRVWAKPVIPRRTVMITMKTHQGRLFLTPKEDDCEEVENLIGYCLGRALEIAECSLHGACVMGNHPHISLTDREGLLPKFKSLFHPNVARAMNAKLGRFGKFWSRESCDTFRNDDDDTLADLAYILTNPSKAGLVKTGGHWPGFTTYGWKFGETRTYKRPKWFFDPENPEMPDEVSITLTRPPVYEGELSDEEVYERLMAEVKEREARLHEERRVKNKRCMGLKKLFRQDRRLPPRGYQTHFEQARRVAGTSRWQILAGLNRDRQWEQEYADAMEAWEAGNHEVEFPYGTYQMKHRIGARVAAAPP